MARALPPLKALRVFEAAARLGSFSAAAEELNITNSAVSQQIRILEDYVGQPLFVREARGVSLLPHARAYHSEVQASLDRIVAATQALLHPSGQRTLRVCATPSLAMKWLIPRLSRFNAQYPDIDVQLATLGRQFIDRGDEPQDVVIRHGPMQRPDHHCVRCLEDYYVPVAAPAYIRRHRIYSAADCLAYPLLKVAGYLDHWPRWFDLAGVNVPAQLPGPTFDHHFLCMQAASNGLGLALAPWSLLEEDVQADRLRPLFSRPRLPNAGIHTLYRPDGPAADLARLLIDWLAQQRNTCPLP